MDRSHPKLIAALLTASGCVGLAQAQATQQVEITASTRSMRAADAVMAQPAFATQYALSNGRRLDVAAFADGLLVSYGRRPSTLLRPDGQGNFLSRDGQVALSFDGGVSGEPERVHLFAPAHWL